MQVNLSVYQMRLILDALEAYADECEYFASTESALLVDKRSEEVKALFEYLFKLLEEGPK